jgi:TonB family protein
MTRFPLLGLAFLMFTYSVSPSQVHVQQSAPAIATITYPNNSEGLRQLLNNMLVAAKRGDQSELESMIRETEIPNYQSWFTSNFGKEKGDSWAEPYGRWLVKDEKEFQELMVTLAHMDGDFATKKMDTDSLHPVADLFDGYVAYWKKPLGTNGEEERKIGDFFFAEGKFRWYTGTWYDPFQKRQNTSLVMAKLVKKVQPEYPPEAREKRIEGTVKLKVVLRKDGFVTVQSVAEGDPLLSPAAIDAVRQWRYEPTLVNGQPIDMETTIEVTFTLTK